MFMSRGAKCLACDAVFCCPSHRRQHEKSVHGFVVPKNKPPKDLPRFSPLNNRSTLVKSVLVEQTRKRSLSNVETLNVLSSIENRANMIDRKILMAKRKLDVPKTGPIEGEGAPEDFKLPSHCLHLRRELPKSGMTPSDTKNESSVTSPPIGNGGFTTSTPVNLQEKETQTAPYSCDTPSTTHVVGNTAVMIPRLPQTPLQSSLRKRKLSTSHEYYTALDELPSLYRDSPSSAVKPKYAGFFSRITSFVRNIFHANKKDEFELSWAVPKSPSKRKITRRFLNIKGRKSYRHDV